jgi:hypothetical protein
MATITDPARELADICALLNQGQNLKGEEVLATAFEVPAWSTEFYQIIFTISGRIDELKSLVGDLDMDEDIKDQARQHLDHMMLAFTPRGLANQWSHSLQNYISPANVGPIRMLSAQVRQIHSYPKLDEHEVAELVGLIDTLLDWLETHQINEQDFIRQAIVEGLRHLRFRLSRVQWLGWGYTIQSLRDVIGAYMALERGSDKKSNPDAEAVLKKTQALVTKFFEKVRFAEDAVQTGDFMLRAYAVVTLISQGKQPVTALLANLTGS